MVRARKGAAARDAVRAMTCDLAGSPLWIVSISMPLADAPGLTPSERDILRSLLKHDSASAIATRRGRSLRTVLRQIESVYRKVGVHSRAELLASCAPPAPARRPQSEG